MESQRRLRLSNSKNPREEFHAQALIYLQPAARMVQMMGSTEEGVVGKIDF